MSYEWIATTHQTTEETNMDDNNRVTAKLEKRVDLLTRRLHSLEEETITQAMELVSRLLKRRDARNEAGNTHTFVRSSITMKLDEINGNIARIAHDDELLRVLTSILETDWETSNDW